MADTPWIREPSVKTVVRDNGNRTALEQWALLTAIPATVLSVLYLAVRSQLTADAWYTLFTVIGIASALGALVRWGRWHAVEMDPTKTRRPEAALIGLNLIANSWPLWLLLVWQAAIVNPLSITLADNWSVVMMFVWCACALFSTVFFGARIIRELRDPLAGNSIEIGVRERELKQELRLAQLDATKLKGQVEYAQKLEAENSRLKRELAIAAQGSRVIFANHGTAHGDSTMRIDNNEMFNRFVYAAFGGEKRKRDEWSAFLIADPRNEIPEDGKRRYWEYRTILTTAGLWNMKTGPIKTLEEACEALRIPPPQAKFGPAGGRAGVGSALAVPPDFDSGAGGSDEAKDEEDEEGEADDE